MSYDLLIPKWFDPDLSAATSAPTAVRHLGQMLVPSIAAAFALYAGGEPDLARRTAPTYPSATAAAPANPGMPLPMMLTTSLRLDAVVYEVRTNVTGHFQLLQAQQTVGQPTALRHKPSNRVEAESYAVRTNVTGQFQLLQAQQSVGQPLALFHKPSGRVEAETYEVRSAPPHIHRFRTGFQTVGQPLWLLAHVSDRIAERDFEVRSPQLSPWHLQPTYPSSGGGMPLPLMLQRQRDHKLYDTSQYTVVNAVQLVVGQAPSAPPYQPLDRMLRKAPRWELWEDKLRGVLSSYSIVKTPTPDVATQSYDFQFLHVTWEVPDLNDPIWHEKVRYHTNHARLMQALRQYGVFTVFNKQFDATAHGSPKFCVEPEVWADTPADAAPPWTPPPADSGTWTPPSPPVTGWTPPSPDSGVWATPTPPASVWDTQQKFC